MDRFIEVLGQFRRRLIDLSGRNKLIKYNLEARRPRHIDIVDLSMDELWNSFSEGCELGLLDLPVSNAVAPDGGDENTNASTHQIASEHGIDPSLELALISARPGKRVKKIQTLLPFDECRRRITRIRDNARIANEEKGINSLHCVFGFLQWYESKCSEKVITSPILLVPVRVDTRKSGSGTGNWELASSELSSDDDPVNPSLRLKLQHDFGLDLPEWQESDSPASYFEQLTQVIRVNPKWRILSRVVIANFAFPKLALYEDLDLANWENGEGNTFLDNPILQRLLVGGEREPGSDEPRDVNEADVSKPIEGLVFDADSSQLESIRRATQGESFVLEGPPGTGKSQTISNLIGVSIAQGMKVLFVADKKAAIEVVEQRMTQAGLGAYCLNLHESGGQAKEQMYACIQQRMEQHGLGIGSSRYNDSETALAQTLSQTIDRLDSHFSRMVSRQGAATATVADVLWGGLSARTEWKKLPLAAQRINIPKSLSISIDKADEVAEALSDFELHAKLLFSENQKMEGHALFGLKVSDQSYFKRDGISTHLDNLTTVMNSLRTLIGDLCILGLNVDATFSDIEAVAQFANALDDDADFHLLSFISKCKDIKALEDTLKQIERDCPSGGKNGLDPAGIAKLKRAVEILIEFLNANGEAVVTAEHLVVMRDQLAKFLKTITGFQQLLARLLPAAVLAESQSSVQWVLDYTEVLRVLRAQGPTVLKLLRPALWLGVEKGHWEAMGAKSSESKVLYAVCCHAGASQHLSSPRDTVDMLAKTLLRRSSLRFFQPSWWRARAEHRESLRAESLSDAERLNCLDQAQRWHLLVAEIRADSALAALGGCGLDPLESDFDAILDAQRVLEELREAAPTLWGVLEQHGVSAEQLLETTIQGLDADLCTTLLDAITLLQADYHADTLKQSQYEATEQLNLIENALQCIHAVGLGNCFPGDVLVSLPVLFDRLAELIGQEAALSRWTVADLCNGTEISRDSLKYVSTAVRDMFFAHMSEVGASAQICLKTSLIEFTRLIQLFKKEWAALKEEADLDELAFFGQTLGLTSIQQIAERIGVATQSIDQLSDWAKMQSTLAALMHPESPCSELLKGFVNDRQSFTGLSKAFRALLAQSQAREILMQQEEYPLSGTGVEILRRRLARDHTKWKESSVRHVRDRVMSTPVWKGCSSGRPRDKTGLGLIRHELGKKKRRISPRSLIGRSWSSLMSMMPCFMMSPMTTAQYLSPKFGVKFDLVIIDEASQMRPEEALSVIARGAQLVVVGDSQQLPPTNYFAGVAEDDEVAAEDAVDSESVLDMAKSVFSSHRLGWHYRSRHDSLIQFSNQHFYDGRLIVCPSSRPISESVGIHLVSVNGQYQQSRNHIEAQCLVDKAIEFMQKYPDKSIGIVAINHAQREWIVDLLANAQQGNPMVAEYLNYWEEQGMRCFVKNLENVQGDERDIILISTVYGPAESGGRVLRRFGPINSAVGHRRLNVLFTRARDCMYVFTSLKSSDVRPDDGKVASRGVDALASFLDFAGSGIMSPEELGVTRRGEPDSPFEEYVGDLLLRSGYEFEYQVGQSGFRIDIGVKHPSFPYGYIAGLECDGALYHSSKAARDRDCLRQEILEGHGWTIYRIWSTDWFNNPQAEGKKLVDWLNAQCLTKRETIQPSSVSQGDEVSPGALATAPLH